jgi:hypothetical protein
MPPLPPDGAAPSPAAPAPLSLDDFPSELEPQAVQRTVPHVVTMAMVLKRRMAHRVASTAESRKSRQRTRKNPRPRLYRGEPPFDSTR